MSIHKPVHTNLGYFSLDKHKFTLKYIEKYQ